MPAPEIDKRSPDRQLKDEEIAAEPLLKPLDLAPNAPWTTIETRLHGIRRHPFAVEGVVENGLVRPLDPTVKLLEHSRVIIVASVAGG